MIAPRRLFVTNTRTVSVRGDTVLVFVDGSHALPIIQLDIIKTCGYSRCHIVRWPVNGMLSWSSERLEKLFKLWNERIKASSKFGSFSGRLWWMCSPSLEDHLHL